MDASSLESLIDRELSSATALDNWHGITLESIAKHRTTPPVFARFENAGGPDGPPEIDAWIVLDECPDSDAQGYLIAYYPAASMFGLALKNDPLPTFIGCYGSFVETVDAM